MFSIYRWTVLFMAMSTLFFNSLVLAVTPPDKSGDGDLPVTLIFENKTKLAVELVWIDREGQEKVYTRISPADRYEQGTYSTHLWRMKTDGKVIDQYRATEAETQTVTILPARTKATGKTSVTDEKMPGGKTSETGSKLSVQEVEDLVQHHNLVRKEVGVVAVKWSKDLAIYAQEWADELAETGKFEHRPNEGEWAQKYGENLAAGKGDAYNVLVASKSWYAEKEFYASGTPIPTDFSKFQSGHYTQMTWNTSTELGAGKAIVKTGSMKGWLIIVCNYNPPGNYTGEKPY